MVSVLKAYSDRLKAAASLGNFTSTGDVEESERTRKFIQNSVSFAKTTDEKQFKLNTPLASVEKSAPKRRIPLLPSADVQNKGYRPTGGGGGGIKFKPGMSPVKSFGTTAAAAAAVPPPTKQKVSAFPVDFVSQACPFIVSSKQKLSIQRNDCNHLAFFPAMEVPRQGAVDTPVKAIRYPIRTNIAPCVLYYDNKCEEFKTFDEAFRRGESLSVQYQESKRENKVSDRTVLSAQEAVNLLRGCNDSDTVDFTVLEAEEGAQYKTLRDHKSSLLGVDFVRTAKPALEVLERYSECFTRNPASIELVDEKYSLESKTWRSVCKLLPVGRRPSILTKEEIEDIEASNFLDMIENVERTAKGNAEVNLAVEWAGGIMKTWGATDKSIEAWIDTCTSMVWPTDSEQAKCSVWTYVVKHYNEFVHKLWMLSLYASESGIVWNNGSHQKRPRESSARGAASEWEQAAAARKPFRENLNGVD